MRHDDKPLTRANDALTGQLRWYGAAAAAAGVLAIAPTADAQIVYTDIPDVTLMSTDPLVDDVYSVDFDGDGDPEIDLFESGSTNYAAGFPESTVGPDQQNAIVGTAVVFGTATYQYFVPLSAGAAISSGVVSTTAAFQFGPTFTYVNGDPAGWVGAGDKYVGTRFSLDGVNHFGWIRVEMPANGTLIVRDFAYESSPGTAITAGDTGAAACDAKFTSADLAYDAGTRVLSVTGGVRNNGGDPVSLRLELRYNRNGGNPQGTRVLANGTLPGGASAPININLNVPAAAPNGDYNFTLALVDTGAGADCATYVETIAISAPRVSGSGTGPLFAEAPEVDLAAVATRGATVQHRKVAHAAVRGQAQAAASQVLSETGANPFRGMTTLALEVASTQQVRVEVFDALGRQVAVLHEGAVEAGAPEQLVFDGSDLAAGVYVVRVSGETFSTTRTLTLLK
ncbi:MAG: T9SS type A sorting domain-containing protein [Rubricoccaceae bacterium]|nr:T9SS type A sorting domain-containing protein [Rubricoccaceae bacterium]